MLFFQGNEGKKRRGQVGSNTHRILKEERKCPESMCEEEEEEPYSIPGSIVSKGRMILQKRG